MLNNIVLMGRLVKDPELRYTQTKTPVASFCLAVERDHAASGQDRETDFIDCIAWRSTGEFVSKYFRKGSMAAVSGRLQLRDWTDQAGNKRRSAEVVVENAYFCERKGSDSRSGTGTAQTPITAAESTFGAGAQFTELTDDDGNLPF